MAVLRTIKKATLQLGLVILPLEVCGAVDEDKADLVNACQHKADDAHRGKAPARIKRREFCPRCMSDDTHSWSKGGMVGTDHIALVDPTAYEALVAESKDDAGSIKVSVHAVEDLASVFYSGKAYYLRPAKGVATDGYATFVEAIVRHPEWAILGEFSFGGMPSLYWFGVLTSPEGTPVMAMRQLARPDLVRAAPVVKGAANLALLPQAEALLAGMVSRFEPTVYVNKQVAAIRELVAAAAPVPLWSPDAVEVVGAALSLGEQLAASLAAHSPVSVQVPVQAPAKPVRRRPAAKKVAAKVAEPIAS